MTIYKDNAAALLPNGLVDLLPPQAEAEAQSIATFMGVFSAFGYQRVKPPLVEFEDSLLGGGPGQKLARQTFRLMDPVSQHMMGVRADVTAQIARIATSRLKGETRPLRLSYAADVLRVNGTQLRPERQFCQVGCELIGEDSVQADVELALLAIKALSDAGIKSLSIDLTVPTLTQNLYEAAGTTDSEQSVLNDLIEKRDLDGLKKQKGAAAKDIAGLMEMEGTAARAAQALSRLRFTGKAQGDLDKLLSVAAELQKALDVYGLQDTQITISPLERRGFEYQTGVSFTLFAGGARGELGRGGRYDVGGTGETATGFTLYMDTIQRIVPPAPVQAPQAVSVENGWDALKALQDKGLRAFRRG